MAFAAEEDKGSIAGETGIDSRTIDAILTRSSAGVAAASGRIVVEIDGTGGETTAVDQIGR